VTEDFDLKHKANTLYVVISKHPYFWFHSVFKSQYTFQTEKTIQDNISIDDYIKQPIVLQLPRHLRTNPRLINFLDFVDYYNKFYNGSRLLPQENTVYIQYEQFLANPMGVVMRLSNVLLLRGQQGVTLNKNKNLQSSVSRIVDGILAQPTKSHGTPRHGIKAKKWYATSHLQTLYSDETRNWIDNKLDKDLMSFLGY
jgi:hypothetical protein